MTQIIRHNGHNIVDGVLQLEDLNVNGCLDIHGCAELTALPEGLTDVRFLDLSGCTALTALPEGLIVFGRLNLEGCTAINALPKVLSVGGYLEIDKLTIGYDSVDLFATEIAETIRTLAIGRRLGDLIEHWVLTYNRIIESFCDEYPNRVVVNLQRAPRSPHIRTL